MAKDGIALKGAIGRWGFFTLSFGAIVGSGWVMVLGPWLTAAAPGGAILGFALAAAAMILIGLCYAELAVRFPRAGAEFSYTLQSFGRLPAFLVGWFLILFAVSVCAFEGIALAWLLQTLAPSIKLPVAYFAFGRAVTLDALIIGIGGALLIGVLHYRGSNVLIRFQNIVTFLFLFSIAILIATGIALGDGSNLEPFFTPLKGSFAGGAAWVFATGALFLNGFQSALYAIEERRPEVTVHQVIVAMLAGIVAAAAFYCLIIVAAGSAAPWQETAAADLPAAYAFSRLPFGYLLGTLILVVAAVSLTKTWTAIALIGSRVLHAKARDGFLPSVFASVSKRFGSPNVAIAFVTICSIAGILCGRAAVIVVVNTCSIALAFIFIVCIAALWKQRSQHGRAASFNVPGGKASMLAAGFAAAIMAAMALVEAWNAASGAFPIEGWLLIIWTILGALAWLGSRRADLPHPALGTSLK